ncbi:MAG: urate hydroxylase PuuD [Thermoanaerobaculia bacterium]
MDGMNFFESLFRWGHIVAGVLWVGLLWFFNFVNSNFAPTMDADTKKKVIPELMPRALWAFRWGAAWTWITGLILLGLVYYNTGLVFKDPAVKTWGTGGIAVLVALLFFVVYDPLAKAIAKTEVHFVLGLVVATAAVYFFSRFAGFGFRGTAIHLGAMFGTIMAANVWMRIWPAQKKIITATKNGEKPDPAVAALASLRSKHNTYMSVPLIFTMMSQHATWAASYEWTLPLVVLLGWGFTYWMYKKAATVKGF